MRKRQDATTGPSHHAPTHTGSLFVMPGLKLRSFTNVFMKIFKQFSSITACTYTNLGLVGKSVYRLMKYPPNTYPNAGPRVAHVRKIAV